MARRRPAVRPAAQLELSDAPSPSPAPAAPARPPVILRLGPRDYSLLAWTRDEAGELVYRVVKDRIKAASTAAVLARKLKRGKQ